MSRVVERLFLTVPRGCLQFVIVVFPDHTHLLFLIHVPTVTKMVVQPTNKFGRKIANSHLSVEGLIIGLIIMS